MTEHFERKYNHFSVDLLDKVIKGGSLSMEIDVLRRVAKEYIERASLAMNAHIALNLSNAWQLIPGGGISQNREIGETLRAAERQLYDFTHDDLFIVAAFENYAKAMLLSKRYVVHLIQCPKSLSNQQKKKPIHINTIRAKCNLPELWFKHHTIGVGHLLKPNYIKLLNISDRAEYAIGQCRGIRNQIHFGGPNVIGFGSGLYEGLIDLRSTILGL